MTDQATITRWRALLIGVRDYVDPSFTPVRFAVEDVKSLADVLDSGGYQPVRVLHSDRAPDEQPMIQNITDALGKLCQGTDEHTLLLVYFAGHGVTHEEEAYLLPAGRVGGDYSRFALSVRELEERLLGSGTRAAVLMMDACHAGARLGTRGADSEFVRRVIEQARGLAVLSASDRWGVAHEDETLGHGVFTHYLLEALRGKAHVEGSPYVTAGRAYEHVVNQVTAWSERVHKDQKPTWGPGTYGDLPLLRLPEQPHINPFIVGPAVRDPSRFYGRKAELQAIIGRVGAVSAQSISIVGERRSGKSSLLWQIKKQAGVLFPTNHRYVVAYLDLSSAAGSSNRLLMRMLRRELTIAGLPTWQEGLDGDLSALYYTLEEIETTVPDARLVLCLDEFEYISEYPAQFDGLLGELRYEGEMGRLAIVTASRTPLADLCKQGRIAPSPFFNIFTQVVLGPLDEESWLDLVRNGLGEVSESDLEFLAGCTGHHPFLTQMAGSLLWDARLAGTVDYNALQAAFDAQAAPHYAYWNQHHPE